MSQLQAGVYRVDITPPVGISMVGYYARKGVSQGIERPLTATAVVLADEDTKIAIVSCDIIFIQSPDVDEIRRGIADAIGTDWTRVLINCSHTHCGPTLPSFMRESDGQLAMQQNYVANLKKLLVGCAAAANHALKPARVGSGIGAAHIGINRREKDADGKVTTWTIEHSNITTLAMQGYGRATLKAGQEVTAVIHPGSAGTPIGLCVKFFLPDGKQVFQRTTGVD